MCTKLLVPLLVASLAVGALGQDSSQVEAKPQDLVGRHRDDAIVTPVNQLLTPYGTSVDLPGMRPQALALSPDGRVLVAAGKVERYRVARSRHWPGTQACRTAR